MAAGVSQMADAIDPALVKQGLRRIRAVLHHRLASEVTRRIAAWRLHTAMARRIDARVAWERELMAEEMRDSATTMAREMSKLYGQLETKIRLHVQTSAVRLLQHALTRWLGPTSPYRLMAFLAMWRIRAGRGGRVERAVERCRWALQGLLRGRVGLNPNPNSNPHPNWKACCGDVLGAASAYGRNVRRQIGSRACWRWRQLRPNGWSRVETNTELSRRTMACFGATKRPDLSPNANTNPNTSDRPRGGCGTCLTCGL